LRNIIQFGSILSAAGCKLNFDASTALIQVIEYPPDKATIIEEALHDIDLFDDTALFLDGLAAIHLADLINGYDNPLTPAIRNGVLEALGIKFDGVFVSQTLSKLKTNRSWHLSETPGTCTYFGDLCILRGVEHDPHKRGRRSIRAPDNFHPLKSNKVAREQLVTPAVEALVRSVDPINVVSKPEVINLEQFSKERLEELVLRIQQEINTR